MGLRDVDLQWATPLSAQYPRWLATTGSGNNLAICPNIVIVRNEKNRLMRTVQLYTYGLDRHVRHVDNA